MFRRSTADVSTTFHYPRLTPWATELPPLRGFFPTHSEGARASLLIKLNSSLSPLRGSANLNNLTQGSQSLALGLTLTAASPLV